MDQFVEGIQDTGNGVPDIMSIVMNRGLGKRAASEQGSSQRGVKIRKNEDSYDEPDSACEEFSRTHCNDETADMGEEKSDEIVDDGLNGTKGDTIKSGCVGNDGNVEGSSETNEDLEDVLDSNSESVDRSSQPQVQVFDELSNDSSNGLFAITGFQSLNSDMGKIGDTQVDMLHETGKDELLPEENSMVNTGHSSDNNDQGDDNSDQGDADNNDQGDSSSDPLWEDADAKAAAKEDGKKTSRKQHTPKRLPVPKNFKNSKPCIEDTDQDAEEMTENDETKVEGDSNKPKSEKSRKQFKPQRILQAFGQQLSKETNNPADSLNDSENEDAQDEVPSLFAEEEDSSVKIKNEPGNTEDCEETYYSAVAHEMDLKNTPAADSYDMREIYKNLGQFPGVLPSPSNKYGVLDKIAWQNEMLLSLTQNLFQTQTPSTASTSSGIEENLDVVRKLREIRFHRYRKITIAEKKEIADYAKVNGVSAAAGHYGVSKSAVSMWTRTDFTDMDDDSKKKKKNCMLGNEKFEELLVRVKAERANKFKGLSKQDKFEVSRYAKLVGVREMARCLDVALGTVSGWMRQYPYNVENKGQGEGDPNAAVDEKDGSISVDMVNSETSTKECGNKDKNKITAVKQESDKALACKVNKINKTVITQSKSDSKSLQLNSQTLESCSKPTNMADQKQDKFEDNQTATASVAHLVSEVKKEKAEGDESSKSSNNKTNTKDPEVKSEGKSKDDVDKLIAENLQQPDIDKCYENIQDMIYGTPLQGDKAFEQLFRRVLSCRSDKYKYLKASEKLEVVRYAKQNGVRKMAKILGLATGTLSGWNTKYQSHLGLQADDSLHSLSGDVNSSWISEPDNNSDPHPGTCLISENFGNVNVGISQSPSMLSKLPSSGTAPTASTPSVVAPSPAAALLDNPEKSEVLAIKYLMKDRFSILVKKIEIARNIKFRNISREEKVDIVKCAKLVGIRPTARVLNMPIGTLSGWITKYSNELHPVYHVSQDESAYGLGSSPADKFSVFGNLLTNDYTALLNATSQQGPSSTSSSSFLNSTSIAMAMKGMTPALGSGIVETPQEMRHYAEMLQAFSETSVNFSEMAKKQEESAEDSAENTDKDSSDDKDLKQKSEEEAHEPNVIDSTSECGKDADDGTDEGNEVDGSDDEADTCIEEEAEILARQYIKAAYGDLGMLQPTGV